MKLYAAPLMACALTIATACSPEAEGITKAGETIPERVVEIDLNAAPSILDDKITAKILGSVVQISTVGDQDTAFAKGEAVTRIEQYRSFGSGVILDDNVVLTAGHVVNAALDVIRSDDLDCPGLTVAMPGDTPLRAVGSGVDQGVSLYGRHEPPNISSTSDVAVYPLSDTPEAANVAANSLSELEIQTGDPVVFANFQQNPDGTNRYVATSDPTMYAGIVVSPPSDQSPGIVLTGLRSYSDPPSELTTTPGASGGGVFDPESGEVVGMSISAHGGRGGYVLPLDYIDQELLRHIDLRVNGIKTDQQFELTYIVGANTIQAALGSLSESQIKCQ